MSGYILTLSYSALEYMAPLVILVIILILLILLYQAVRNLNKNFRQNK
jgi:high-affinity Fe2+/Pb2+ permease